MTYRHRFLAAGLTAVAALASATPASAASASPPAGAGEPVGLVVGLAPGAERDLPAEKLATAPGVDVLAADPVGPLSAVAVEVPAGDAAAAMAALRTDPAVRYVVRDRRVHKAAVTANDPLRAGQWALDRAGVPGAWQYATGAAGLTVAVIDTGVTATPDLAGAMLPGIDLVNGDSNPADDDPQRHGTQVASVVAARGNNNVATAGVCWSCKILPVKVLAANGSGSLADAAEAITYAADNGADVINLSLGGPLDPTDPSDIPLVNLFASAVAYAQDHGALVVAAAGNAGTQVRNYPAAISTVLSVGASDQSDNRYDFSSYGASWVDIAAPGCVLRHQGGFYDCGTSFASPMVAGIAALGRAVRPAATAVQISTAITSTGVALADGAWTAHGRVNAQAVVRALDSFGPAVTVTRPAYRAYVRGQFPVYANAIDPRGVTRVELLVGGVVVRTDTTAPYGLVWNSAGRNGTTNLAVRAFDTAGNSTTANRSVIIDNGAPSVGWYSAPAHGRRVSGTVAVRASAGDTFGVARVDLLVNGVVVGRDATAPYAFALNTRIRPATMNVHLRAYDRAGNVRASATRTWRR